MIINVNKKEIDWDKGTDLLSLIQSRDEYIEGNCAVVINGKLISKSNYGEVILKDGDKVRIVHLLAGG